MRQLDYEFHRELDLGVALHSPTFEKNGNLPTRCSCEGGETRPAFLIDSLPEGTQSLALVITDQDSPMPWLSTRLNVHYAVVNLAPGTQLPECPANDPVSGALILKNSFGKQAYCGPCPWMGRHAYRCRVYALAVPGLKLTADASYKDLLQNMEGKILKYGERIGYFED